MEGTTLDHEVIAVEFSPPEIRRKTFQLMRRGFDPQEVGAYLEQLSTHVADVQKRLTAAETTSADMEKELTEARSAEEAVRLTMLAATSAKEEILTAAQKEAESLRKTTIAETDALKSSSREEADRVLGEARREALRLLEASRRDAEEMVNEARAENEGLIAEVATMRSQVEAARQALTAIASGALDQLSNVDASLQMHGGSVSADGEPRQHLGLVPPVRDEEAAPRDQAPATPSTETGSESGLEAPQDDDFAHVTRFSELAELAHLEGLSDLEGLADLAALDEMTAEEPATGEVVLLPDAVDRLLSRLKDING